MPLLPVLTAVAASLAVPVAAVAQISPADPAQATAASPESSCPAPVLSRLAEHTVSEGETLETIARRYQLLPATIVGFNPQATQTVTPGMTLLIPPYNGVVTRPAEGTTWQDLGERYGVRADVLFELNGCQDVGERAFVPGGTPSATVVDTAQTPAVQQLAGYPLPETTTVLMDYGWQVNATQDDVEFHSGVDLEAAAGTPVLAVEGGVVAFAGEQGSYGKLVVINHRDGLQSRYAQLGEITVSPGQTVGSGDRIAQSGQSGLGQTGIAPHLHFEIRENSPMGWVAKNPSRYLVALQQLGR
ncbi:MAG: M23 family metallopeptidase [Cyanobacteria bacterium P01_A01_bin.135]